MVPVIDFMSDQSTIYFLEVDLMQSTTWLRSLKHFYHEGKNVWRSLKYKPFGNRTPSFIFSRLIPAHLLLVLIIVISVKVELGFLLKFNGNSVKFIGPACFLAN